MNEIQIYKIEYSWYEGEHHENLIGKNVGIKEFERDLLEAKKFAESLIGKEIESGDYLGKGYRVECLPEFYEQIIWYLTERLGYVCCDYNKEITYDISDYSEGIEIRKFEDKREISEISVEKE